ncbi:MAG: nucleotidyltransferase family protein [Myxococcota bacterium]
MLAAGRGRRMGSGGAKHRIEVAGVPMLVRVLRSLSQSRAATRAVVLRSGDLEAAALVAAEGVRVAFSPSPDPPRSLSVRTALAACPPGDATLFALADQPFLEPRDFDALIDVYARQGGIVYASYAGRRGSPALFGPEFRAELLALRGSQGGREVIRRHRAQAHPVALDPQAGRDLDRPQDLGPPRSPR